MEQRLYTRNNLIIAFVAGILVGFGGYYLWSIPGMKNVDNTDTYDSNTIAGDEMTGNGMKDDSAMPDVSTDSISVSDQPAGMKVQFIKVKTNDAWVAIYEDMDGMPGKILGAGRFTADTEDGEVELLRNTVEGGHYYAILHIDDGVEGFDHKKDVKMLGPDGKPIMVEFKAVSTR